MSNEDVVFFRFRTKNNRQMINESKDATQRRNAENVYRRYVKVIEKQKELLAKYPHLKNAQIDWGDLKKEADILNSKAINTSKLANKLYDVRYRELRAQSEQKKDPCRDFIL